MSTATAVAAMTSPLVALLEGELEKGIAARVPAIPEHVLDAALGAPLRYFLNRPGKSFRSRLLAVAYALCDGPGDPPETLGAIVEILHSGSLIVDDIEDESPYRRGDRALHVVFGVPLALNAGNWLYFWAFELVERLDLPAAARDDIRRRMNRCLFSAHYGQALDLSAKMGRLSQGEVAGVVRAVTRFKTGSLMALAAELGAAGARAPLERLEAISRFGVALGEGLQMLDDLGAIVSDERRQKGHEDLRLGRPTWPWAWLSTDLDELAYARLGAMAREVERRDVHPDVLIQQMRPRVEGAGRRYIRRHFLRSIAELSSAIGRHDALGALRAEIEAMERSYG